MRLSKKLGVAAGGVALATILATSASAQNNPWGDLLGGIIKQAIIDNAVKKWTAVDPDVRQCLANSYGLAAGNLAGQGITPDDYRLQNQMQYCNQQVAQARYEQQQRQLQIQQAVTNAQNAWNALDSQVRQCASERGLNADQLAQNGIGPDDARLNGAVQSCRDQVAQAEQARLNAEARHKKLVEQFGKNEAADIEAGRATIGMSKDAVRAALGSPTSVESIPPSDEMWVYGSERIAISNGKVTYVGH